MSDPAAAQTATAAPIPAPPTITLPALTCGELYAGIILGTDGTPSHHVILLSEERGGLTWRAAQEFAGSIGGAFPTLAEQALLYANVPTEFLSDWYWCGEPFVGNEPDSWGPGAYCHSFGFGGRGVDSVAEKLRARAVRRVATHSAVA